jgi:hypothetical protein
LLAQELFCTHDWPEAAKQLPAPLHAKLPLQEELKSGRPAPTFPQTPLRPLPF